MRKHTCGRRCEGGQHRFIVDAGPRAGARSIWDIARRLIEEDAYYGPARVTRVEYRGRWYISEVKIVTQWEVTWVAEAWPGVVASGEGSGAVRVPRRRRHGGWLWRNGCPAHGA